MEISVTQSKIWYNWKTGEHRLVAPTENHTRDVLGNPDRFGVDSADLSQNALDYDGVTLLATMKAGWVRLRLDPRDPDYRSNVEGTRWPGIRKAVEWLTTTMLPRLKRLIVVLRTGAGDKEGDAFIMDPDQIEFLLRKGRPDVRSKVIVNASANKIGQMLETIRFDLDMSRFKQLAGIREEVNTGHDELVRWATGPYAKKYANSHSYHYQNNPEYTMIEVNIDNLFRKTGTSARLDIRHPTGGKNSIGQRVAQAKQFWKAGNYMDPPQVSWNGSSISFTDGRHRLVAAYQLGAREAPILVPTEYVEIIQKKLSEPGTHMGRI